jgi:type IV pilus assembly protein PilA
LNTYLPNINPVEGFSMKRNRRGFTIVEVIVVAVIVAVLAAVAIPKYLAYISSTKQDGVSNMAKTVAAAANTYLRRAGTGAEAGMTTSTLNLGYVPNTYSITFSTAQHQVTVTYSGTSISSTETYWP